MNIQGNIGWINVCRTDPSKSYVIGGSEEANEEKEINTLAMIINCRIRQNLITN